MPPPRAAPSGGARPSDSARPSESSGAGGASAPPRASGASSPQVVARDTVVLGALTFLASLSSFGFQWAMARLLTPADYATLFALLALFTVLSVPSQMLLPIGARMTSLAVVRRGRTAAVGVVRRALLRGALVGLAAWAAVVALSGVFDFLIGTDDLGAIVWLGAAVAVSFAAPFAKALLTGLRAFVLLGASNMLDGVLRMALGAGLVGLGMGVAGGMAASALASLLGVMAVMLAAPYVVRAAPRRPPDAPADAEGAAAHVQVGLLSLSLAVLMNVDILVVRHFFADADAALYAASALVGRIVLFASVPAAQVVLPHVIRHVAAGEPLTRTFGVAAAFTAVISGGAALVIAAAPELVFAIVFGDRYAPDPPLVWAYVLAGALLAALTLVTYFHIGAGTLRIWTVLVPLSVACAVTLWVSHESLTAVAWTLDAFLGSGVLVTLGWAAAVLRRHRAPAAAPTTGLDRGRADGPRGASGT